MNRVLGIDVETTGLNSQEDRIIEIGACLFEWESATPLQLFSCLVDPRKDIPAEITQLTGITQSQVDEFGEPEEKAIMEVDLMLYKADYVMAHNAPFDKGFYYAAAERSMVQDRGKIWLDSMQDVVYPKGVTTRNLNYLAAESGFINPWKHRSLFDVMTMLRVASEYSLEMIVARSKEPMVYVQALVSYDENQKAKDFSFRWSPEKRIWWKQMKQSDWMAERGGYQFKENFLEKAPE